MDSMRLSGLATGLDTSSIIQQLMGLERRPIKMWEASQAKVQSKLDLYRQLNTKLSALERAAEAIKGTTMSLSSFNGKKAVSGNSALFTVSAGNNAAPGSFNVEVVDLAKEQKTGGDFTTAWPSAGGTLEITKVGVPASAVDIVIAAGSTAEQVAATINGANAGMTATVIDNGVGGKALLLTGKETGAAYSVTDDGGGAAFATSLGVYTATGAAGDGDTYQAAAKAHIKVDGTLIESATNTFTTALTDVTINAIAVGTSTITVSQDQSGAVAKVKDFVEKYNDVIKFLETNSNYDAKTEKGGLLLGDSITRGIRTQLSQLVTDRVMPDLANADVKGYSEYASNVGIELTREGTLKLDEAKLNTALSASPNLVYDLFSNEEGSPGTGGAAKRVVLGRTGGPAGDGIAVRISGYIESLIKTGGSYLAPAQDGHLLGAIKGLEKSIDGFDDRIEAFERRLELRERSLRAQFTAMERSVATLRSQGSYMASQLGGMMG